MRAIIFAVLIVAAFAAMPMPKFPKVEFPKKAVKQTVPKIQFPKLPTIEVPKKAVKQMPKIEFPKLPTIEVPKKAVKQMPKIELPKFPKIEFPKKAAAKKAFTIPKMPVMPKTVMPWEMAPVADLPPINFTITNCGDPNTDYVVVKKAEVTTPMPIHEGDYVTGSFEVSIVNDMKSLSASLTIEKQMSETQWIKVPCLGKIGSCNYDDVCSLLSEIPADKCKAVLGQDCQCPIKARDIKMDNVKVGPVPKIPSMFSGNFRVTVNAMETSTQKRAACYVITASVSA